MRSILGPGIALVGALGVVTQVARAQALERFEFTEHLMGSPFRIVVYADTEGQAREGAAAAFRTVARLDSLFSDYRPDSEVAELAARSGTGDPLGVSPELWTVLGLARSWTDRTEGAFDVTVGPFTRLWRWSARRGELPDAARLDEARKRVGFHLVRLEPPGRAVRLTRRGMGLDLGGIAKGYAADAALAELRARGLHRALVDGGGDLALGAPPPGSDGWRIALPQGERLVLADAGVATSGDRHRYLEVDGVRYAHVVDPRSGVGVRQAPTVTVIAPDGTTADVLASALTVMDAAAGKALLASVPGASARVQGSEPWISRNFPPAAAPAPRRDDP